MSKPERMVMGVPPEAVKVRYHLEISRDVERLFKSYNREAPVKALPIYTDMESMLRHAVELART